MRGLDTGSFLADIEEASVEALNDTVFLSLFHLGGEVPRICMHGF